MEASFLEIYNETLRDLLATSSSGGSEKLEIRLGAGGHSSEVHVTNLTLVEVTSEAQVRAPMTKPLALRALRSGPAPIQVFV